LGTSARNALAAIGPSAAHRQRQHQRRDDVRRTRASASAARRKQAVAGRRRARRGLPLAGIRENLAAIIRASREAGAAVVLVGIELPINYGPQYRDGLRAMYRDLSQEFNLPLVPFLLAGVALDPDLMQDDGLHPKAEGEPKVLENVWPVLEPALQNLK
jgi:lysophospholipase L1-like esterase